MKILFLTPAIDAKGASGGMQVTLDRLAALRVEHDVTVLSLSLGGVPTQSEGQRGATFLQAGAGLRPRTAKNLAKSYLSGLPLSIWRNADPDFIAKARELGQQHWDAVYCDHWLVWPAAMAVPTTKRVLHLHNAEHLLFLRAADRLNGPTRRVAQFEAGRCKRYLRRICAEADEVHYLSGSDQRLSETDGIHARATLVFPPACDTPIADSVRHAPASGQALSIGSLSWEPTHAGMVWFFDKVWPHLSGVRFVVGGKGANEDLDRTLKSTPGVEYLGFVPSTEPLYGQSKVFLAPLLDGSGIKIKIINALAHGIPVVTTRVGVEGFPPGFDEFVRVADDPKLFAEHTKLLATLEDHAWQTLSLKSRVYARQHFAGAQFKEWCAGL